MRVQERVLAGRLRRHVEALASVRHPDANPRGLDHAREYIANRFSEMGFETSLQPVTATPVPQFNVLGRMPGDSMSLTLVVEAHHDTVHNSPGADDNASGVAGVLEVARLVGPLPGLEIASFALEEDGLRGAAAYVDGLSWRQRPALIDLEMIGFTGTPGSPQRIPLKLWDRPFQVPLPHLGRSIGVVGNWEGRGLARSLAVECMRRGQAAVPLALPGLPWFMPDVRRSDHARFWNRGLPAVMITDTANLRNPHYHQPSDLPETLDYDFMARITRAVAANVKRSLAYAASV